MSPTARSLAHLRAAGKLVNVVERWNPYARRRQDLFGCIDILALDAAPGVLGIQTTTADNLAARWTKVHTECLLAATHWLRAGNRLELHGWAKRGPRGKRKVWTLTVRPVTLADLNGTM